MMYGLRILWTTHLMNFGTLYWKLWVTAGRKTARYVTHDVLSLFFLMFVCVYQKWPRFLLHSVWDMKKNAVSCAYVVVVWSEKYSVLMYDYVQEKSGCGIIYCRTRDGTNELASQLSRKGIPTKAYNAGEISAPVVVPPHSIFFWVRHY